MNADRTSYRYRAYTALGQIEEGSVEAPSSEQAMEQIWARGLTPFEAEREGGADATPWWRRDIAFGGGGKNPSSRAISDFTREFAILSEAGIPLDDSLRILGDQTVSGPMRLICRSLLDAVLDGALLSEALGEHPRSFGPDYVNTIRAGEAGSNTGHVLGELASLLERRQELAGKIKSALVYPAVLVTMALFAIGVIMNVLIPNIAPIFAQNGKELPTFIAWIVWLQANWQPITLALALALAGMVILVPLSLRVASARLWLDRTLTHLPLIGSLMVKREVARFARTLGTLLRSGVPMMPAFASARQVVRNRFLGAGFEVTLEDLRDGRGLAKALAEHAALPRVAQQMIAIGEEAGKLDRMLIRLADSLEQQTQRQIDNLMTLLTPALTLMIAGLIGTLIFTVMSAIMSINELAVQ